MSTTANNSTQCSFATLQCSASSSQMQSESHSHSAIFLISPIPHLENHLCCNAFVGTLLVFTSEEMQFCFIAEDSFSDFFFFFFSSSRKRSGGRVKIIIMTSKCNDNKAIKGELGCQQSVLAESCCHCIRIIRLLIATMRWPPSVAVADWLLGRRAVLRRCWPPMADGRQCSAAQAEVLLVRVIK